MVDIQSGKTGEHDTRISVIASDAEHTVFLKKGSFASRKTDDMLLLQETERALADKSSPKVIFLHMIGSHPNPCDRLNSLAESLPEQYPRKIACYPPASVNWITFSVSLMVSFAGIPVILPCFTFLTMVCRSATVLILFIMMVICKEATAFP